MRREERARADPVKGIPCRLSLDGDRVHVIADLGEIGEEKIRLDLEGTGLVVSAAGTGDRYRAEVALPWKASLKAKRFRNGVLEITLERSEP